MTFPQVKRMTIQQWETDGRRGGTRDSQQVMGERIAPKLGWFSIALGAAQLVAPGVLSNAIGVRDSDDSRTLQRIVGVREVIAGVGILAADDPSRWLWARVVGDVMDLALLGSAFGAKQADRSRLLVATTSVLGITALDAYTALQVSRSGSGTGSIGRRPQMLTTKTVVVNRAPEEVYAFWRDFQNFPRFMLHLDEVRDLGAGDRTGGPRAPPVRPSSGTPR